MRERTKFVRKGELMANAFEMVKEEQAQAEVQTDDACAVFLKVYDTFTKACRWMATPGRVIGAHDRAKFWQLEYKVDALWKGLSEEQRAAITQILFPAGTMVRKTLEVFGGKVVSLI